MSGKHKRSTGRGILEDDCQELFGMPFGVACKHLGLNVNASRARIRRGIPLQVVLRGAHLINAKTIDGTSTRIEDGT